ncbi:MAG: phosphate regulon transcriptional regulator PhoB [Hyphomicrobium sp.]|jgi:two-component system phosphate regulon response regulator PhoB|nr:phosphate regulon transcriptional regulator PhoB [Hyphomicrobium sp.]
MAAKILIVEDEEALVTLISYNLEAAGYQVVSTGTSDDAMFLLKESPPDLVILDWMLPGASGIEICRQIRAGAATRNLPVIMLTARGEEADKLRGLATGADDYMVKPFSVAELLARIKGLLRRAAPEKTAELLQKGGISIDRQAHRVTRGSREIMLGPTEYRLLEFFMQSAGRVLSRAQLLDNVWGHTAEVDERTVDVHVGRLRKSIVRGAEVDPIRTVRGAGYVFDDKPSSA